MDQLLELRVHSIVCETDAVRSCDLRPLDERAPLPPFTAGAHIDVELPGRITRSYSLLNSSAERHRYVLGIALDRASRGGSRYIHEHLRAGQLLKASAPRNLFPLDESAPHTVLLAGGIGITPMLSMVARLETLGLCWQMHYCVRNRAAAAFLSGLTAHFSRVRLHCDDEMQGTFLDIARVIDEAPQGTHFYCCGPAPMMDAFTRATAVIPAKRVHVEYFSAQEAPATERGYLVELARSRQVIAVPAGQTILAALKQAGFDLPHSCVQGVCGTCETKVLAGTPDHRDILLTPAERTAGRTMMICCSGALTDRLVLDL